MRITTSMCSSSDAEASSRSSPSRCFFFFTDTATTEIYTLSLHDALPILKPLVIRIDDVGRAEAIAYDAAAYKRSEEHTSELQSPYDLVCRLLLEKKKRIICQYSRPQS